MRDAERGDKAWSDMRGFNDPGWTEVMAGLAPAAGAMVVKSTVEIDREPTGDYFNSLTGDAQIPFGD